MKIILNIVISFSFLYGQSWARAEDIVSAESSMPNKQINQLETLDDNGLPGYCSIYPAFVDGVKTSASKSHAYLDSKDHTDIKSFTTCHKK